MTRNNYSRQSGPSWFGFYFSRFLTSRVLRLNVFGRTYRFAWTWHFEAEQVRAAAPEASRLSESDVQKWPELAIPAAAPGPDTLRVAMAAVEEQEAVKL